MRLYVESIRVCMYVCKHNKETFSQSQTKEANGGKNLPTFLLCKKSMFVCKYMGYKNNNSNNKYMCVCM